MKKLFLLLILIVSQTGFCRTFNFTWDNGIGNPAGTTTELLINGVTYPGLTGNTYSVVVPDIVTSLEAKARHIPPVGHQCGNPLVLCQPSVYSNAIAGTIPTNPVGLWATKTLIAGQPMAQLTLETTSSSASVNFTSQNVDDYGIWHYTSEAGQSAPAPPVVRKNGGGSLIGSASVFGSTSFSPYLDSTRSISWSDGTPTGSGTSNSGIYTAAFTTGVGYELTFPADTSIREAYVYLEYYNVSSVRVSAILSDGSVPNQVDTALPASEADTLVSGYAKITYAAASASQTLTVRVEDLTSSGSFTNVTLNGATVKIISSSATANPPRSLQQFYANLMVH